MLYEAPQAAAPYKANKPFIVLVLVFVTAFFAAIVAQIRAHHDGAADTVIAAHRLRLGIIVERVNANPQDPAMGASAGVTNIAQSGDASAAAIATPPPPRIRPGPPLW